MIAFDPRRRAPQIGAVGAEPALCAASDRVGPALVKRSAATVPEPVQADTFSLDLADAAGPGLFPFATRVRSTKPVRALLCSAAVEYDGSRAPLDWLLRSIPETDNNRLARAALGAALA